jgi:arginyl-tRNA synthetase
MSKGTPGGAVALTDSRVPALRRPGTAGGRFGLKEEAKEFLRKGFRAWLQDQNLDLREEDIPMVVEPAPANVPGDLASNLPMAVAKKIGRPSRDVAREIAAKLPSSGLVEKGEIAGPGFLNLFLRSDWLLDELRQILVKKEEYARRAPSGAGRVLIEFVSANPTGPLHVGHGRGAALGDALARIFRHLGFPVTTEYYVNDVGNQMENLGASVMARCLEIDPASLDDPEKSVLQSRKPEDLYRGEYIRDIARSVLAEFPDPGQRPRGLDFFRKRAVDTILAGIREDLQAFSVSMESWFPESRLYGEKRVEKTVESLRAGGHLKEEGGALWFVSTRFGDDKDRVIKRKDERPTYFASDIAYHDHKFERDFAQLIDIWGTDHHGYVARVKAAVTALGRNPEALTVLLYQLVSLVRGGKPVAMSTRSGEFVTLQEVMDEVGKDACRFYFAMRSPDSHLEFDLEKAKKQAPENPVFNVQYAHARTCSLFREAEKRGVPLDGIGAFSSRGSLEARERSLLLRLASYPDVVEQCRKDLSPHHLTAFLLALAADFHRFYEGCRVLGEPPDVAGFRLAIVQGVQIILRSGLSLLGVSAPDSM